jgi:WD40 repeat protein
MVRFLRGSHFLALLFATLAALACPALMAQEKTEVPRKDLQGEPLPPGALTRLGTVRFHNSEPIHSVAFAPDGQALLVFAHHYPNSALRLWNIADGKELARFDLKDANYPDAWHTRAVCFTPDGKSIVLRRENVVELVDRQTGKSLHVLNGKARFRAMALSPDGKVVALASPAKDKKKTAISFWEMATGQERTQLQVDSDWFFGLHFSSDGKRLLAASSGKKDGGIVQVWEIGSGKMLHEVDVESHFYVAFSPDGRFVATRNHKDRADAKDEIRVVRLADGATVCRFKPAANGSFASFAFAPDGKALITIAPGHTPCLWDAATGKRLRAFGGLPASAVQMGAFSADGERFALIVGGRYENAVRLWNVETGEEIRPFAGHADEVTAVAFSPDGKVLASGSYDCTVRLWEPRTGRELCRLQGHKERVLALAFSLDGATLTSASADGSTRLWRVADGRQLAKLDGPGRAGAVPSRMFDREGMKLVFAADGKTLYAVDDTAGYRAWDVATGRTLERKQFDNDGNRLIGLSSNGGTVLAYSPKYSEDGKNPDLLSLWDVATGKQELTLPRRLSQGDSHDLACVGAEISRDGRLLAGSNRRYTHFKVLRDTFYGYPALRIWERLSGQEILNIESFPNALAFSTDGRLLAGNDGGGDPKGWDLIFLPHMGSIYLWDTVTGKCRQKFAHHTAEVRCVAFAPDGKTLASGSADHTVLIWDCSRTFAADKPLPQPSQKQLEAWWESLAADNALEARLAMAQLVRCPAPAARLLDARLKPAAAADLEQLAALVRALSNPQFATRQRATDALVQMGDVALPTLNKALAADSDLETRRRLQQMVGKATNIGYRKLRGVAVLEEIADDAAVRALESLGKGLPESRQTKEALISLRRLRR